MPSGVDFTGSNNQIFKKSLFFQRKAILFYEYLRFSELEFGVRPDMQTVTSHFENKSSIKI